MVEESLESGVGLGLVQEHFVLVAGVHLVVKHLEDVVGSEVVVLLLGEDHQLIQVVPVLALQVVGLFEHIQRLLPCGWLDRDRPQVHHRSSLNNVVLNRVGVTLFFAGFFLIRFGLDINDGNESGRIQELLARVNFSVLVWIITLKKAAIPGKSCSSKKK